MKERISAMSPHSSMPRSIPRVNRRPMVHQPTQKKSADDDPYGAGYKGNVSGHRVEKPSGAEQDPKRLDGHFGFVDVIPGEPLYVTAELKGVIITGAFVPRSSGTSRAVRVLVAEARIGLSQKGFFAVSAGSNWLRMRVGDAGGLFQEVRVETPSYNPNKLVVNCLNNLFTASA